MSFYRHKLTRRDELAYDQLGLALLECSRGTNDVESIHKQITTTFGEWCTGVQMADALLAEVCTPRFARSASRVRDLRGGMTSHAFVMT